jgi:DNA helicase-2/ATP-dependent DNA helicase PcrA
MLGRADGLSFAALSAKAVELLQRAPIVARLIAGHYPVIILDEHQDASLAQHEIAMLLMRVGGARLRIFGDPMQALHHGAADRYVEWDALWASCPDRVELAHPHRWAETPELGEWVTAARATLRAGGTLSMHGSPRSVRLLVTNGLAGRNRLKDPQRAASLLHEFLNRGSGRAVVVAHLGEMVRTLAQGTGWRAGINEGAMLEHLDQLLAQTESRSPTAESLARAFLGFVDEIGSGFGKPMREGVGKRLGPELRQQGAGVGQRAWLEILAPIYADPSHRGLAAAMGLLLRAPPADYHVRLGEHAKALRALGHCDEPRGHLHALSRLRRRRALPQRSTSTVHKAKGLEFRRVLVCPADQHQYPSNAYGARLLYVAMSRATHELTIVADAASPISHIDFASAQA